MDWSDLRFLLAFEEEGTLEAVARVHGVTASTVSRRLRALERGVGAKLVENVSGRLMLTGLGERAVEAAGHMREHADELLREIAGQDDALHGVVRVGALEIFVRHHAEALHTFRQAHPGVELHVMVRGAHLHNLTQREADVVLRVTSAPMDTLVGRPVMRFDYAPFAHPSWAPRVRDARGEFDPAMIPWIGWHDSLGATMSQAWIAERAGGGRIAARVTTTTSMLDLAAAGMGACLAPVVYGRAMGLAQLAPPLNGFGTQLWILTHRDLAGSARVRALTRHLVEHLSAFEARVMRGGSDTPGEFEGRGS